MTVPSPPPTTALGKTDRSAIDTKANVENSLSCSLVSHIWWGFRLPEIVEGEKVDGVSEKMQTTPPEEQMDTLVVFTAYHLLEEHRAVLVVSV
jgi:hypothetical protein